MEVLKNLLGDNTKINAKEIASLFEGAPETLDIILNRLNVKTGSNANGNWVILPDGTMICIGRFVVNRALVGASDMTVNFPKEFKNAEIGIILNSVESGIESMRDTHQMMASSNSTLSFRMLRSHHHEYSYDTNMTMLFTAIGKG